MFGRAPRFPPEKASDVPGPNHYTLPEEEGWDSYKKGAFLEKADRFQKEKPYEGPDSVPSASEQPMPKKDALKPTKKPDAPPAAEAGDRSLKYITLRKELDELQRIHDDGKKSHRLETQQLKTELERQKKTFSDQQAVLRKQVEMADAKAQDSKKALLSAQTEMNELRLKLKMQEKEKATATTSELSQAKRAVAATETAKRELELKLADMEKSLQAERGRREAVEAKIKGAVDKAEQLSKELKSTKNTVTSLEEERDSLKTRLAEASTASLQANTETDTKVSSLQTELDHCKDLLRACAGAYGSICEDTAPKSQLESLRLSRAEAFSRLIKLERRLADKDAQFLELVAYTRHKDEQISLLQQSLENADGELKFLRSLQSDDQVSADAQLRFEDSLEDPLMDSLLAQSNAQLASTLEEYHLEWIRTLLNEYKTAGHVASSLEGVLAKVLEQTASLDGQLQVAQVESESARKRAREADELTGSLENTAKELKEEKDRLLQQLADQKTALEVEVTESKKQVEETRKRTERLEVMVKEKAAAEKALTEENETLTNDLRDALRYEHAYKALSKEVDALVIRNELVEREADHLSRFNAEILGHTNPNQKIHYLDRIRRDLADTKHKLAISTQQRETVLEDNDTLRNELYAYRSVSDSKPKAANITRVARAPLSMSVNGLSPTGGPAPPRTSGGSSSLGSQDRMKPMTIEDLM